MQADAVTETGYYWQHRKNREPRIVHYHGDWFAVLGNDTPFEPQHIKGELIGPIKYDQVHVRNLDDYPPQIEAPKTENVWRNHFAFAALTAMHVKSDLQYSKEDHRLKHPQNDAALYATTAFRIADAMLAESQK
jgi:hypothetical protein